MNVCLARLRRSFDKDGRRDRGSVTAELAAALPALLLLMAFGVAGVTAASTKMRCLAAARDAAIAAARGEDGGAAAARMLPAGARVGVTRDGDLVRVSVTAEVRPLGRNMPGFTVSAQAVAAAEPGAP
ncbi:hypothetical protein Val02_42700 [Virgisporangium aliadipatigenens]|uniref:Pilus assembly protein TadE n=1 Tax=Virgisporangium aliadipatigenens TaxID=741659 RepID=A0A8J3YKY9_9ACTN|nr:TadE family type IV pilus minor pilin [Virgisporangium aliadipatigenens]GIJ47384.1 hypothetical protein Val02_42700 [Virgisporangium aliadipatigenens]